MIRYHIHVNIIMAKQLNPREQVGAGSGSSKSGFLAKSVNHSHHNNVNVCTRTLCGCSHYLQTYRPCVPSLFIAAASLKVQRFSLFCLLSPFQQLFRWVVLGVGCGNKNSQQTGNSCARNGRCAVRSCRPALKSHSHTVAMLLALFTYLRLSRIHRAIKIRGVT
jgi:hypothetical protein